MVFLQSPCYNSLLLKKQGPCINVSIHCGIDNKNSVALTQDDTTCTEIITEANAGADLPFDKWCFQSTGLQSFDVQQL